MVSFNLERVLEANKESVQTYYDTCNSVIEALKKQLEAEDLSFEERKYIIEKMMEISKVMGEKDSENKRFIATMAVIGAAVVGTVVVALAAALGGNTQIEGNDDDIDRMD